MPSDEERKKNLENDLDLLRELFSSNNITDTHRLSTALATMLILICAVTKTDAEEFSELMDSLKKNYAEFLRDNI